MNAKQKAEHLAKRGERLRKIRMASAVARALGVDRANDILFPAVAAALGRSWVGSKRFGYQLVMEYAATHDLKAKATSKPSHVPHAAKPEFLESYAWRRLRMEVLRKRGARCECCGATPKDGKTVLNVDHIKPRKLFPELALDESNLQVLCAACNHGKGNWDQTDWREPVVGRLVPRCSALV